MSGAFRPDAPRWPRCTMFDQACPRCGCVVHASEVNVGRSVKCVRCGEIFPIERPLPPSSRFPEPESQQVASPPHRVSSSRSSGIPNEEHPASPLENTSGCIFGVAALLCALSGVVLAICLVIIVANFVLVFLTAPMGLKDMEPPLGAASMLASSFFWLALLATGALGCFAWLLSKVERWAKARRST
jgi:hypothetical protein